MASVLDSFNSPGFSVLCRKSVRVPVLHLLSDRLSEFSELEVDSFELTIDCGVESLCTTRCPA